ncbi:inositol monophosphatase family protein [Pedomonas mirosovicensis]|uniref:inositol monophosphatase family protein n=1 Tax=Pedomonas mirosovicensis TaxID=2908641 RepID=UPI002167809F|nr:inositol monophosphatase family protein [Pedomonas mirosovicensis]MCH8685357.1 inositol monophosphatase [Pedomonas mirosovicensis]
MPIRSALITVIERAVRKAGSSLRRDFGEVEQLQVSRKGPADFVSAADQKAERILKEELKRARPDFGFLMEESGEEAGSTPDMPRWIVDPLDGTTNFLHGIPHYGISVALEEHGEIIAGVVYNPLTDETFWAEKGKGAWLGERRLRVSGRQDMRQAVVATGIPYHGHGDHERFSAILSAVMQEVAGVRRFGAASLDLAYVAAGRFDAFWEDSLQPWDIAAGILLIREAGGFVSDFRGGEQMLKTGEVVAGNAHLQSRLHKLVAQGIKAQRG